MRDSITATQTKQQYPLLELAAPIHLRFPES